MNIEELLSKYKKDLATFKDLLESCNPNNVTKIKRLQYKVSCHRNMVADLEKIQNDNGDGLKRSNRGNVYVDQDRSTDFGEAKVTDKQ